MPINPIQLFQSGQTNFLSDYMGGAQNVIGNIFDKAIQSGRDMVNNQMKQDSDLMNLRAQETALAQRRGENLQQNIEDAQRNSRNIFESDRKFDYVAGQDTADRTRQMNNDIFSQGMQTDRYNLDVVNTEADNARADRQLSLSEENTRIGREVATRKQNFYQDIYAPQTASSASNSDPFTFNAPNRANAGSLNFGQPQQNQPQGQPQAAEGLTTLRMKYQAAQKAGDAPAMQRLSSQIDAFPKSGSSQDSSLKEREIAAKEQRLTLDESKLKNSTKRNVIDVYRNDPVSFPTPETWIKRSFPYATGEDGNIDPAKLIAKEGVSAEAINKARTEYAAYNADPENYEVNKALTYETAEDYANALDPNARASIKKKRMDFWKAVNSEDAESATTPTSPTSKFEATVNDLLK